MSYDFGSETLGIKNPFKVEGKVKVIAGIIVILSSVYPLLLVADALKTDPITAYTYAIVGFILLALGVQHTKNGISQLFRYFVGRSVPTSLAQNYSTSEEDVAKLELSSVIYDDKTLHSMLMGRKNVTFVEPKGWVARLIHSLFPKLTFLPYPFRVLAQEIGNMAINFSAVLISSLVFTFIVVSGLAGEVAQIIAIPIISLFFLIYLVASWRGVANAIHNQGNIKLASSGGASFAVLLSLAILVPVILGFYLDQLIGSNINEIRTFQENTPLFSPWANMGLLLLTIFIVIGFILPMLLKRMAAVTPQTEVSEYRDNMQENVHPNEIFINVENIILANRRYKEIPNRIYRNFDPQLREQAEGKGSFDGQLLIETQPTLAANADESNISKFKIGLTITAQFFWVLAIGSLTLLIFNISDAFSFAKAGNFNKENLSEIMLLSNGIIFALLTWRTLSSSANIMANASHLFWGELKFSSLLMYMKTEGTYTEARISTGMSIHDSTRSENNVVRSSITPWIISSRISSSIFATTGTNNLESPRFIMGMNSNKEELDVIVKELQSFLRGRETIASITNEADLQNASTIHQVNQQTRAGDAMPSDANKITLTNNKLEEDELAAGFLRNSVPDEQSMS